MSDLSVLVNPNGMVSSKLIAEKFGKSHRHVLRDIRELQKRIPNDSHVVQIWSERPEEGMKESYEVFLNRDAFSLLAMGFTGESAFRWKMRFLEAFNTMEETIRAEIPTLQATIARLQREKLALPATKRPHGNKNRHQVSAIENSVFPNERGDFSQIVYKRVPKDDNRYSRLAVLEGELYRISLLSDGLMKKMKSIARELAHERRR